MADPESNTPEPVEDEESTGHSRKLFSGSFVGLLVTQFLGATNDNMIRWLVIGIGKEYVAPDNAAYVLSAGLACFVAPYLLLAAPAGYLADRFSKRRVIVACKLAEIVIMVLAVVAIFSENLYALFAVVAVMGCQSALFGPSKLGSIPEMLHPSKISAANRMLGLTTVVATVLGSVAGLSLYAYTGDHGVTDHTWASPTALIGVAVVGWLASLLITPLPPADPTRKFPYDAPQQTLRDLRALMKNRAMFRVALGIAFFWTLGSIAQLNIDQFGLDKNLRQEQIAPLLISLVVGVAGGSVLAGLWSRGRVELGILPLGAAGVAISAMLLFTVKDDLFTEVDGHTASFTWSCVFLLMLGISAGLFDVPLAAYMQHHSPAHQRGAILAATNFVTFAGILGASGLYAVLRTTMADQEPMFSAPEIFLLLGVVTIPIVLYIVILIPQATLRFAVWLASQTVYRIRVQGHDNLPTEGGALLVANHVSWIDGILLLMASSRPVRVIAFAPYIRGWAVRWFARSMGVIPIDSGPKAIRNAIKTARQALADGQLVAIFPEGQITRTGQLQPFKAGMLSILKGTDADMVPVYLDEVWGSIFSFERGRFFWKRPRQWPYPISIHIGRPVSHAEDSDQIRSGVQQLGTEATQQRMSRTMIPPKAFLRRCRQARSRVKVADTTGRSLTGSNLLTATLLFRRVLRREVYDADEKYIGVLLPSTVAGVLVNAAAPLDGRIAVNLNYTVSSDVLNECIRQCGIRHVVTSRKMMERLNLEVDAELFYLEDLPPLISTKDKLISLLQATMLPMSVLDRMLGLNSIRGDDVMTVIFTSGSTGQPKGVMLTYDNVGSNVSAIDEVVHIRPDDTLGGILPFFHSLGFTVTLWTPLSLDMSAAYHANPLEAKQVGKLCSKHGVTIMLTTPTFLRSYLKRVPAEDFATLDVVVAGAEKLPPELCEAFEKKFGVRPVEGYGATELSPLAAVNIPPSRSLSPDQEDCREGTVGRPVTGVSAKVVDPDTREDLPVGEPGMLLIKGPNVMKGYLDQPDKTAEVLLDGWYETGDIALIDDGGFIKITGRLSRFSKIGGEMVPHVRIEEAILQTLDADEEQVPAVVTAIPDARKGERLIVMHTALETTAEEICQALKEQGLPNLWIPSPDSFCQIDEIPVLGTGKLDLKGLKDLAKQRFADGV